MSTERLSSFIKVSTVDVPARRATIVDFTGHTEFPGHVVHRATPGAAAVAEAVQRFQHSAMSDSTRRGYATDWARFEAWCQTHAYAPLPAPPSAVAAYLASAAGLIDERGAQVFRPATMARWLAAINHAHFLAGFAKPGAHPEVQTTLAGIRRELGGPQRRMAPLLLDDLRNTLATIDVISWPAGIAGYRDYALLLMGFAGAFRRSELAGLDVGDVTTHSHDGLHVRLRRSKTDQEGKGTVTALPFGSHPETCAPCAHARWVRHLSLADAPRAERMKMLMSERTGHVCREPLPDLDPDSPMFRPVAHSDIRKRRISDFVVRDVVQRRVRDVGLDAKLYGGHSLRAGFITQAFRAGRSHHEIMRQTHHRSYAMLEVYSRENDPLRHNAVTGLGL